MEHLASKVSIQTGLPEEQIKTVIAAVAVLIKEKYPLLASTVDMVLEQKGQAVQS